MRFKAIVLASLVAVSVAWIGLQFDFEGLINTVAQQATTVAHQEDLLSGPGPNIYTRFNTPFVRFLVNRGLSTQDSERVIGEAFHDAAICWFAAGRSVPQ